MPFARQGRLAVEEIVVDIDSPTEAPSSCASAAPGPDLELRTNPASPLLQRRDRPGARSSSVAEHPTPSP
jgi:hypothetical protein